MKLKDEFYSIWQSSNWSIYVVLELFHDQASLAVIRIFSEVMLRFEAHPVFENDHSWGPRQLCRGVLVKR